MKKEALKKWGLPVAAVLLIVVFWVLLKHISTGEDAEPSESTVAVFSTEAVTVESTAEGNTETVSGTETATEDGSGSETEEAASTTEAPVTEAPATEAVTEAASEASPQFTFRYDSYLDQHYEKHGIEMGFASEEDYLAAANAVVNNPASLHKTEKEDGDDVYFLEETGEFVVVSTDGYIRTYFIPSSGKAYYDRQ